MPSSSSISLLGRRKKSKSTKDDKSGPAGKDAPNSAERRRAAELRQVKELIQQSNGGANLGAVRERSAAALQSCGR